MDAKVAKILQYVWYSYIHILPEWILSPLQTRFLGYWNVKCHNQSNVTYLSCNTLAQRSLQCQQLPLWGLNHRKNCKMLFQYLFADLIRLILISCTASCMFLTHQNTMSFSWDRHDTSNQISCAPFTSDKHDSNRSRLYLNNCFKTTNDSNQDFMVMTCDQQLYKIVVDITFPTPVF